MAAPGGGEGSWATRRLAKHKSTNHDDDFDCDIREILETGDVGLLEALVTEAGVDINHSLVSVYKWSLALFTASRGRHELLRFDIDEHI